MEGMPAFVGCVTFAAGAGLVAAPARTTGFLGLTEQDTAIRLVGLADLVLVPGLLGGRPRWPWMVGRAALNLAQAAYFLGVAPQSSAPVRVKATAGALLALTVADGATARSLRRAGA